MVYFKYAWKDTKTKKSGIRTGQFKDQSEYIDKLTQWNRQDSRFKYFSEFSTKFNLIKKGESK